jgi:prepilin-type N-terminal cleavage/methylation domain-containing protein
MNNKGFSLIELLGCLLILSLVLFIGVVVTRRTLATSLTQLRVVSDNEIFDAARTYALETSNYKNDKVCVSVKTLILEGYLDDTNDEDIKEMLVQVSRDKLTKTIEIIRYVDKCE